MVIEKDRTSAWLMLLAFLGLGLVPVIADIVSTDAINDVYYRGLGELAGGFSMRVNGDEFADASSEQPIFIRIVLGSNAFLARTLVDLPSGDPVYSKPIYLALSLHDTGGNAILNAPSDAVSIVRWISGESAFWIKIQSSSSDWINVAGNLLPPQDDNLSISWTIGVSARLSSVIQENFATTQKNLPFNTRNPLLEPDSSRVSEASSTLVCVDLSNSALTIGGIESLLHYTPEAYGPGAEIELGEYAPNGALPINFNGNFSIARGKKRECSVSLADTSPVEVCLPDEMVPTQGQATIVNVMDLEVHCNSNPEFMSVGLWNGSRLTLSILCLKHISRFRQH